MDNVLIFRTKLINEQTDYDGFEFSDVGLHLTDDDKRILVRVAEDFYRKPSLLVNEMKVMLSLGEVSINGFQDPIASRMKIIEGFIQREPVLMDKNVTSTSDDQVKHLFEQFLSKLFQVVVGEDDPNLIVLNKVFPIVADHLNRNTSNFDGNYLLYCNLKFLCDTVYKDNLAMKGLLNTLQSVYKGENLSLK